MAIKLGKFVHEVEELTPDELAEYLAYFKIENEEKERAERLAATKAKQQAGRKPGRRR